MTTLPSEFLDTQVLPRLFERLDIAFPECGWKLQGEKWVATNEQWSRSRHDCRPDRIYAYRNSRHCYVVQGAAEGTVSWISYVAGGTAPKGKDYIVAVRKLTELVGLEFPEDRPQLVKRISAEWSTRLADTLHDNQAAMEWLLQTRRWSRSVVDRFGMGLTFKSQGADGEHYERVLTFPHHGPDGKPVGHYYLTDIPGVSIFQKADDHRRGGTWGRRMEKKPFFYGSAVSGKRDILLVEGFKDLFAVQTIVEKDPLNDTLLVITATHGAGSVLSSAEAQNPEFWSQFDHIYLGLDNDAAGQKAVIELLAYIPKPAVVPLIPAKFAAKEGKRADWNDLLRNGTLEDFKAVLAEAKPKTWDQVTPEADSKGQPISFEEVEVNVAYHNGYLYWPFEKPIRIEGNDGKILEGFRTFVLRSDGLELQIIANDRPNQHDRYIKRLTDGTPIVRIPKPVSTSKSSWHWSSIQTFAAHAKNKQLDLLPQPTLGELANKIYKHLRAAVYIPYREDYATITLGIITSYCQEIFDAVPLFLLIGDRGSGKTELGKYAAALGCNGAYLGRTTVAGLMEACDRYRGLVAVDDFEELGIRARGGADAAINDMAQVIKQSYKKAGGTHTRVGSQEGDLTERNLYGVKFLNNTLGADPITLSRMFPVRTRKMTDATKDELRQFEADLLTPVQIREVRNQLHVWIYSHVPQIAQLAAELKKDRVNRDDEIALPLRVLAKLADQPYLVQELERAIVKRSVSVTDTDEETAMREALRTLVGEGHEYLNVYQVMNEMASMLGNTHGADSKSDLPEWQRPHVLGKRLLGFWFDEHQMVRKRLEHEEIANFRPRFYQVLPDRRQELIAEIAKAGTPTVLQPPNRRPGDFCSGCEACKYREKCFIRQDYSRQTAQKSN